MKATDYPEKIYVDEIWKPLVGYEGLYEVSSYGNVRSIKRIKPYMMHPTRNKKNGYLSVLLSKEGTHTRLYVHRLVATAFIEKPSGKEEVDHINTVRDDNRISNLKWCTRSENCNNATTKNRTLISTKKANAKSIKLSSKVVICYSLNGDIINEYISASEASRVTGISRGGICNCCRGEYKTAGGFIWRFKYI